MRLNRAGLILTLTLGVFAAPPTAGGQQAAKVPRIGFLTLAESMTPNTEEFRQGLRELGYVEGQNIAIEYRFAQGKADRLPAMAAELVSIKLTSSLSRALRRHWRPRMQPKRFLLLWP